MPRSRGFTLIEVLVVVTVIAIIAAIAIPNLLGGIDKGKQKRTMADLRTIGSAVEAYRVDNRFVPDVGGGTVAEVLRPVLEPTYIKSIPTLDGWRNPIRADAAGDNYSVVSLGKDGKPDAPLQRGPTTSFASDIYFSNGQFSVYPDGTQK